MVSHFRRPEENVSEQALAKLRVGTPLDPGKEDMNERTMISEASELQ
jgi:hypothetical protein